MVRKCPVCLIGPILRADVKTCSPTCAAEWRGWTPQARAKAMEVTITGNQISLDELNERLREVKLHNSFDSDNVITGDLEATDAASKTEDNPFLKEILGK